MVKGLARGRNAPVATSEGHAAVLEGLKPRIERSFESSRLEGQLLAGAYEALVPIPGIPGAREPLERLENLASAIPAGY